MYEAVRQIGVQGFILREAIPLALSLIIAEVFFKFGSFSLEVIAFLATWFLLSAATAAVRNRLR